MRRVLVLLVVGLLVIAACGSGGQKARSEGSQPPATPLNFSVRGPHAVGATRLAIDAQRPVEVFYPADPAQVPAKAAPYRYTPEETWGSLLAALPPGTVKTFTVPDAWFDIPATPGPFPLVVFSHGVGMMRFTYTLHAAHLASWGYVVALPEQPSRDLHARLTGTLTPNSGQGDLLDTVTLLQSESSQSGNVLHGLVTGEQVAAEGHSAGGRDAALAAYDAKVDTWIGLAPGVPIPDSATVGHDLFTEWEYGLDPAAGELDLGAYLRSAQPPNKPSMMVVADRDLIFPLQERRAVYDWLPAPKRFVVLADAGHSDFLNDCQSWQRNNGSRISDVLGFAPDSVERKLLENGCLASYAPVEGVWATWDHLTIAQLNLVFGINPGAATASLDKTYLDATFPGRIAEYDVQQ